MRIVGNQEQYCDFKNDFRIVEAEVSLCAVFPDRDKKTMAGDDESLLFLRMNDCTPEFGAVFHHDPPVARARLDPRPIAVLLGALERPGGTRSRFLAGTEGWFVADAEWPEAVAAIRPLAFTGCRRSEVLNLRWRDIGADAINLRDSKTGPRAVPLGEAARAHVAALPGARNPDAFLFPRYAEGRGAYSLAACWRVVCADAKPGSLRLHDLRLTAASQAVMSGEGLPLVGRLLGHNRNRTTAGYAHLADAHIVETAEKVGAIIATAMARQRPRPITYRQ